MMGPRIPLTAHEDIAWPALPAPINAPLLALEYQFLQSQWWPPETLLAAQLRQLELVLAHVMRTVPFYQERLPSAAKLRRGGLTMETWRRLPLLRRRDIQEAGQDLVSRRLPKGHEPVNDVSTSGSTGRPITVISTRITKLFFVAMKQRYHFWHDRDFSGTLASIRIPGDHISRTSAEGRPTNWVFGYPSGPASHLDVTNPVSKQSAWLEKQKPDYLFTYPSNLAALLRHSEETGVRLPRLREVMTGGEVLDPAVRSTCARVWGVPVTESYAAVEMGMIALQCPEHPHYHVQAENVLVEVLGPDNKPCGPGETGRVVVTSLNNFATPLIRCEIGDYAEVGAPCPCGRGLPVLNRILGRARNMATLPSGEQFWPRFYSDDLATIAPVRQVQLVQRSVHDIDARLVVARAMTPDEEDRLKSFILEYLGHPFTLRLVYVDEIPRSASGKYEDFLSMVDG